MLSLLCVIPGVFAALAAAQNEVPQDKQAANTPVSVAVKLESQEYCRGDDDIALAKLALQVTMVNVSRSALLVHKASGLVSQVAIAKSLSDMRMGRYEKTISYSRLVANSSNGEDPPSPDEFVVLRPLESYLVRDDIRIPFLRTATAPASAGIRSGEHFISVTVAMWPESPASLEAAREAVKKAGVIFAGNVRSAPVRLDVIDKPVVGTCDY